jgi:hypothetical protein
MRRAEQRRYPRRTREEDPRQRRPAAKTIGERTYRKTADRTEHKRRAEDFGCEGRRVAVRFCTPFGIRITSTFRGYRTVAAARARPRA